jgi:hypothetical protein
MQTLVRFMQEISQPKCTHPKFLFNACWPSDDELTKTKFMLQIKKSAFIYLQLLMHTYVWMKTERHLHHVHTQMKEQDLQMVKGPRQINIHIYIFTPFSMHAQTYEQTETWPDMCMHADYKQDAPSHNLRIHDLDCCSCKTMIL